MQKSGNDGRLSFPRWHRVLLQRIACLLLKTNFLDSRDMVLLIVKSRIHTMLARSCSELRSETQIRHCLSDDVLRRLLRRYRYYREFDYF